MRYSKICFSFFLKSLPTSNYNRLQNSIKKCYKHRQFVQRSPPFNKMFQI